MITPDEMRRRGKEQAETCFAEWMGQPLTKAVISMIPPTVDNDALKSLLRSAFDAGHSAGQGLIALEMLMHIHEHKRRD